MPDRALDVGTLGARCVQTLSIRIIEDDMPGLNVASQITEQA